MYNHAYKIRPLKLGNNPLTIALRSLKAAGYAVTAILGSIGPIVSYVGYQQTVVNGGKPTNTLIAGAGMTVGGMAIGAITRSLDSSSKNMLKLMDIKNLLSKQDMDSLRVIFNRTQKIKGLLDKYETWGDVPDSVKEHAARYFDETYRTMDDLNHTIALVEIQRKNKLAELNAM